MIEAQQFPLLIKGRRFKAYYQRGAYLEDSMSWKPDENGSIHLVVCECGRCSYAFSLDDAVDLLCRSYVFNTDAHAHAENTTYPCNIIEQMQEGSEGWVMGTIVEPGMLIRLPQKSTN